MSSIRIRRESGYADRLRSYRVLVDDRDFGKIEPATSREIPLVPGQHTVQLKIDWASSNILSFNVGKEETVDLACGNSMKGLRLFLSILYITIWRDSYLWLKRE